MLGVRLGVVAFACGAVAMLLLPAAGGLGVAPQVVRLKPPFSGASPYVKVFPTSTAGCNSSVSYPARPTDNATSGAAHESAVASAESCGSGQTKATGLVWIGEQTRNFKVFTTGPHNVSARWSVSAVVKQSLTHATPTGKTLGGSSWFIRLEVVVDNGTTGAFVAYNGHDIASGSNYSGTSNGSSFKKLNLSTLMVVPNVWLHRGYPYFVLTFLWLWLSASTSKPCPNGTVSQIKLDLASGNLGAFLTSVRVA